MRTALTWGIAGFVIGMGIELIHNRKNERIHPLELQEG